MEAWRKDSARSALGLAAKEASRGPAIADHRSDPINATVIDRPWMLTPTGAYTGLAYALAAYMSWGFAPIYFKAVAHVPVFELLAHRAVWSAFVLILLACLCGRGRDLLIAVSSRKNLGMLVITAALLATTWLTFLWAVVHDRLLQVSMAHFIGPLVSVLLGFLFLKEQLRKWQTASVLLAVVAVAYLAVASRQAPTVAIVIAVAFGIYGLLRKKLAVDPLAGVVVEMGMFLPFGVAYLLYLAADGSSALTGGSPRTIALLPLSGVVTGVPLLCFVRAAPQLRLATLGFLLYITPSLIFILSITAFGETLSEAYLISFIGIWAALLIYSTDTICASRTRGLP